jgi:hypothetical protein
MKKRSVKPPAGEAIDKIRIFRQGASLLFYPAALPLSRQALTYTAGIIRRHRKQIGSPWRRLNPGRQAPLVYMHKGAIHVLQAVKPEDETLIGGARAFFLRPEVVDFGHESAAGTARGACRHRDRHGLQRASPGWQRQPADRAAHLAPNRGL